MYVKNIEHSDQFIFMSPTIRTLFFSATCVPPTQDQAKSVILTFQSTTQGSEFSLLFICVYLS